MRNYQKPSAKVTNKEAEIKAMQERWNKRKSSFTKPDPYRFGH